MIEPSQVQIDSDEYEEKKPQTSITIRIGAGNDLFAVWERREKLFTVNTI